MSSGFMQKLGAFLKPAGLKGRPQSAAEKLYYEVLAASRDARLYADYGVEDNIDGRFDALCLLQSLMMRRLSGQDGEVKELAQGLFDAMFADMDLTLREMGVGDMGVGKRVKLMSEAYMGRLKSYDEALSADDKDALAKALRRNLYRVDKPHPKEAELAVHILAMAKRLESVSHDAFLSGMWDSAILRIDTYP